MSATTIPVSNTGANELAPEFGSCADVKRIFGLKRGTLYNLMQQKKIRSVSLRITGRKKGLRLIDLQSVRDLLRSSA